MDMTLTAAILIALLGLPHGALDPLIAYRIGLIKNLISTLLFLISYVLIVLLVVGVWLATPVPALICFLLISALHFGRDWKKRLQLGGLAYGFIVLGLPSLFHPESVSQIFEFLLFGGNSLIPLYTLQIIGVLGIGLIFAEFHQLSIIQIGEIILLALMACIFEPLLYFVIYFCGLHSPRHLFAEFLRLKSSEYSLALSVVLVTTITTLAIAVIVGSIVEPYYDSLNILMFQTIFIGLAGLTLPHMCLLEWVDFCESNRSKK